jgi:3-oxoacyl-[acyl-carrier-protein] synthase-3
MSLVLDRVGPAVELQPDEFVLLVTTSRISHITDYECPETSGLFGDMATATMISRSDSQRYPVRLELTAASTDRLPTNRPFFDFVSRNDVPVPTTDGGKQIQGKRIVFTLDGMGVADSASRAMAAASMEMAQQLGLSPGDIDFIIPHQAGSAIVRLAEMKMRDEGFTGEVVNGMANQIGNVSSGSIPYAIHRKWQDLHGNILCPVASVGRPGKPFVTAGCIALRAVECNSPLRDSAAISELA